MRPDAVLRLALAQINTRVGDFAGNVEKLRARLAEAAQVGADVVVFPELAVTGYPPEDLLLKPNFLRAARKALASLLPATRGLTAVVGTVEAADDLYNAAAVVHDGALAFHYRKQCLPNYGVFDERRYFRAGEQRITFRRAGATVGISICEDIWYPDGPPMRQAFEGSADVLLNLSASPYHRGKGQARERMLSTRADDSLSYVAYCNLVGGQDELVFDGQSFVTAPHDGPLARARQFEEDLLLVDLDLGRVLRQRLRDPRRRGLRPEGPAYECIELPDPASPARPVLPARLEPVLDPLEEVYKALVLGTRDYARKNGFGQAVVGLSGGIDSSLVAAIATDALGPKNVVGVSMPTRYSSSHSRTDAELLAKNLGIRFMTVDIDRIFQSFLGGLAGAFEGAKPDVTEENLQSRIRGTVLMALSNKYGWLVLTTGNKSEVSVGYYTVYGDSAGGFSVIKDLMKTLVYDLCRHRNAHAGFDLIPQGVLDKPPSAELRPDQKDSDSLPEYATLDPILHAYVEENMSVEEIAALGFPERTVRDVVALVDRAEYKRRQSPPGIKITPRAFGKDWRVPITNGYRPSH